MHKTIRSAAICLAILLLPAALCSAGDWPHWRGPHWNGVADETNLPAAFSQTENVNWTAPMPGHGAGTPIISGDRVFVSSSLNGGKDLLGLCFDRKTGKELWRRNAGKSNYSSSRNDQSSASPVTDGERVYFYFGTGELSAFDFDGQPLWSRNLAQDYGPMMLMWVYSSSPTIYDGKMYIPVLRNTKPQRYRGRSGATGMSTLDSYLICIDPKTGQNIWKYSRPSDANDESLEAYTTAIPMEHGGRKEILVFGGDYLTGHDPQSGKEFWRVCSNPGHPGWLRVVPSPVYAEGLIYTSRPKNGDFFAVKAGLNGEHPFDKAAWTNRGKTSDVCSPLVYRGRLYWVHSDQRYITCANPKTGEIVWQEKLSDQGIWRSSPTGADGKIYLIGMHGEAVVLEAGDQFKVLCRVEMGGKDNQASVAAAHGQLFVRTSEKLFCIGKK